MPKKTDNPRKLHIDTKVNEEEYNYIDEKARNVGLTKAEYLRNLGMNYPIKSVVDQRALSEIVKLRADLGRLGGLFKLWLVENKETKHNLGDRTYKEVNEIANSIEKEKDKLINLSKRLLKNGS